MLPSQRQAVLQSGRGLDCNNKSPLLLHRPDRTRRICAALRPECWEHAIKCKTTGAEDVPPNGLHPKTPGRNA